MSHPTLRVSLLIAAAAFGSHAAVEAQGRAGLAMTALTTDQTLLNYSVRSPVSTRRGQPVAISGLVGDDTVLVGIDYRPADGLMYGLGNGSGLYTVDPATGVATLLATLVNALTFQPVALDGARFDLDFNPAADALRVVSDTGQNLRIIPSARIVGGIERVAGDTFVDGTLNTGSDPFTVATGITAAAYTNNDNNAATTTMLFTINTDSDVLSLQNPPNNGTQMPVGPTGVDALGDAGFDIYSTLDENGVAIANDAYAVLPSPDGDLLYAVDVTSGAATVVSRLAGGKRVVDIAIPTAQ